MWIRLFAASRSLSDLRPSRVKFSRFESRVYFCPLMKRRCFPVNRAYSLLRTLSKASPRWRSTWNLSKRMLASGAWGLGRGSKRLPHVHDSHSNTLAFPGPQPLEELVHARLGAILAAKPDGPPSYQVTHDDPVGVPLPDRDLVDADHFRSWRPGSSELLLHVLLLERLDRVPVQMQLLSNILDRRGSASTTDVEAKALGVERIVCEEVQLLLLHLAAAHTIDAADFEIQKRSGVAA